jgi:hypothetical protein
MLERLLGPTLDYLGDGLRDMTERRTKNIARIIYKASQKVNEDLPGQVPPRLIKNIFDDGSFSEDELTAEYLAGVLASSKSPHGRDDRGVALTALVNRLSMYTLRTHYIFYTTVRRLLVGSGLNLGLGGDVTRRGRIYLPDSTYSAAMGYEPTEDSFGATSHAMYALSREQLIGDDFRLGSLQLMQQEAPTAWEEGLIFEPSISGVELYLWAHGKATLGSGALLAPEEEFEFELDLDLRSDFALVANMKPEGST